MKRNCKLNWNITRLSAASLTSVPAANIVGLATAGFNRSGGFGGRTVSSCSNTLNSTSLDIMDFLLTLQDLI